MSNIPSPWFNYHGIYHRKYPPFSDLTGVDWFEKLKKELPAIKEKTLALLNSNTLEIKEKHLEEKTDGNLAVTGFMFWKSRFDHMIVKGQDLFNHFKDIPGVVTVGINMMHPHTHLKPHYGDSDAIYRIHIPIDIPAQLPECGITVDGITKPWLENELLVFCDAYLHEAWNRTDKMRIIIILDVMREDFLSQTDKICAIVLSTMKYGALSDKYKFLKVIHKWIPKWVKDVVRRMIKKSPKLKKSDYR